MHAIKINHPAWEVFWPSARQNCNGKTNFCLLAAYYPSHCPLGFDGCFDILWNVMFISHWMARPIISELSLPIFLSLFPLLELIYYFQAGGMLIWNMAAFLLIIPRSKNWAQNAEICSMKCLIEQTILIRRLSANCSASECFFALLLYSFNL